MTALVAVLRDEAFKTFLEKELKKSKRLDEGDKVKPQQRTISRIRRV